MGEDVTSEDHDEEGVTESDDISGHRLQARVRKISPRRTTPASSQLRKALQANSLLLFSWYVNDSTQLDDVLSSAADLERCE